MANHPQLDRGEAVYLTTRYLRAVQTWRWARHPYPDNHRLCLMNQKSTRELSQEISPTTPLHFLHREFRGGGVFSDGPRVWQCQCEEIISKQSQNFLLSLNVPLPSLMCKMKTLLCCLILTPICNTCRCMSLSVHHFYFTALQFYGKKLFLYCVV